jgi:polysaccharide pyruvyl transferase WcaK-like protein
MNGHGGGRPADDRDGPVVGVYGYFGMGNIGNEGSLAALLDGLHRHRPDVSFRGYVAGPHQVASEHRIDAERLMWHRGDTSAPALRETALKVVGRVVDVPRTFRMVRHLDALVVPGTGVLETQLMAKPWGMPYWLFVTTLACRARGIPVALVSVGAEPARHPLTRLLFTGIVRMATWVSVRDEGSQEVVLSWGARGPVPVTPDLAFALPVPDTRPVRPGHVVVGVMAYEGDPADPERGAHQVRAYARRVAEAVGRLVQDGRTVTLVVGDVADLALAHEIRELCLEGMPDASESVVVSRATTLAGLMVEMAEAEATVVSRFHNLVCSLKVGRPAVSLSYADKSARLLDEVGLAGLVQPMESFDVDVLLAHIDRAGAGLVAEVTIKDVLRRYDEALEEQLRQLVAEVLPPRGPGRGGRWRPVQRLRAVSRPARL